MQTRRLFMRFTAGLLLVCMLFSIPFSPLLAETDETTTEPDQGGVITVDNPVHGLLDPIAENAPYSDSRAYLIYDTLSDTMLIGSEYDTPRQPASITQIMTILLALEQLQLDDQITITKEMYETIPEEYVRIGFTEGEVVTVEQCIYCSLLKSANDAAMALAIYMDGDVDTFVKRMNTRATELGCTNTHFTNPYGLAETDHLTTCHDMVLILEEALRHQDFITIATTTSYSMEPTNKYNDKRVLNNANRYISTPSSAYEYYIGGKTGYSDLSGYTIIAGAEKEGKRLIGILMGAKDAESRYETLTELFEYCFTKYSTTKVEPSEFTELQNSTVEQINTSLAQTNLVVAASYIHILEYYTVPLSVATAGYSNEIDLSQMVIDPLDPNQYFVLPINRHFSDRVSYTIGYLTLEIKDKNALESEADKQTTEKKTDIGKIILISLLGLVLTSILVFAIVFFIKLTKKRKFLKNHKNPRIL